MKKAFFLILLFSSLVFVFPEKLIIQDSDEFWNIGIADIETHDTDNSILFGSSVSAYIMNKISACSDHKLSETEIIRFKSILKKNRIDKEEKNLNEKQISYDRKYFTDEKNRKELKHEIRDLKKLIKKIKKYKEERIDIKDVKSIRFSGSDDNENLKTAEKNNLYRKASENNFDYIIYGKITIFNDIAFTDITLYSRLENRDISSLSRAFEVNSFYSELDDALKPFFTAVLGKKWSSISIISENKNADIYIDDIYSGTGSISGKIVSLGEHIIKIAGTGLEEEFYTVMLEENSHFSLGAQPEYEEEKLLAVNTFPDGADVYYDSLWQGKSPVVINSSLGEIFIRKEGFRENRFLVEEIDDNSIDFTLSPELFTQKDYLLKKRDNFYKNLSWFVLSAPLPFFMFAVLNDYTNSYNSALASGSRQSEIDRLENMRNYCYYGYYGTLFVSISLFVNMIFNLNDYIEAGDILE